MNYNFGMLEFLGVVFVLIGLFSLLRYLCVRKMRIERDYTLATELAIKWWFLPVLESIKKRSARLQVRHDDSEEKIKIEKLKEKIKKVGDIDTRTKTITELKKLIDELEEDRRNILYR